MEWIWMTRMNRNHCHDRWDTCFDIYRLQKLCTLRERTPRMHESLQVWHVVGDAAKPIGTYSDWSKAGRSRQRLHLPSNSPNQDIECGLKQGLQWHCVRMHKILLALSTSFGKHYLYSAIYLGKHNNQEKPVMVQILQVLCLSPINEPLTKVCHCISGYGQLLVV